MSLDEIGITGQRKLTTASILVIGAGGLGCPLLMYLAGAGVGRIGIVDHDIVEESNLHRQILYHTGDMGKLKADVATAKLQLFNPDIDVVSYPFKLSTENASIVEHYDLVIDGSDNFPTRYLVNDTCVKLNRPLVFGSIFQFEGQVSVFNLNGGPSYRSIYPEPPLPEDTQNCGEAGVIGTLPGIIGSIMANEAIKIICGFGTPLSGKLLVFNTLNNETQLFIFAAAEDKKQLQIETTNEIGLADLAQWETEQHDYLLIDVRETYEFEEHNIGGINIPLYELNNRLTELQDHQRIVFCCTMGKRSKMAMQLAKPTFAGELFSLIIK